MTTTETPRAKGARSTVADMVRSLGLVAVLVAVVLLLLPGLTHPSKGQRFQAIDYSDYVAGFQQVTGVRPLAPPASPSGWLANAGRLTGRPATEHLHIGWGVPGKKYAGLEEGVAAPATFIRSVVGASAATVIGQQTIAGRQWARRTASDGEPVLSETVGRLTVVVTGSATPAQLTTLAAALR